MNSTEQAPSSSHQNPAVTGVVSTPIYKEPHILDREPHIHLATPFEKLEVMCETLVDFDSMRRNGVDLTDELKKQGWENYFQRLYGPVYTNLVKEFWRFADADDHYIVSYVLGVKIVITEKSIAALLGMEKTGGRRIYNINPRVKYLSHEINPTIFQQNAEDFMKRTREPSEKEKQAKRAKLGEPSGSRPSLPLVGSPGKSVPLPPSVKIKPVVSSLSQPSPIYTTSETPPSISRPSNQPSQKFNLATKSLPVSEAEMLNETTSPSSSPSPQSPPYYTLSSDTEPSDPHSPTLAQLQNRALASQQPTHSSPKPEVTSPPPENPNTTTSDPPPSEPIHYEPQPSQPQHSEITQPTPSADPQTPTLNLSPPPPPTSPSQASEPETTLLTLEEAIKAEAKAKVVDEEEARLAEEFAARVRNDALTQGESSTFVPLVLKTFEELQKEQQKIENHNNLKFDGKINKIRQQ
ncbi:uncharacterized protein LOC127102823 [Lathyrus oleraceus]|uniref:uncharacterized protein LOC127102823 n=1 Tax=Pisum sativum TaxID=3888 RepID=UPI0021D35AE2|nr:uncharacterized protein LOC127102823 [Pisum sativum]